MDGQVFGLDYTHILSTMQGSEGDVLHLLECCAGGAVGINLDEKQEALAASTFTSAARRKPGSSPGYFTKPLIDGMLEFKTDYGLFTTAQLAGWIQRRGRHQCGLTRQLVLIPKGGSERCISFTPLLPSAPHSLNITPSLKKTGISISPGKPFLWSASKKN